MRVFVNLIRHGITEGNAKHWVYGGTDVPLTEEGKQRIKEYAKEGIYPKADGHFYFTSGMLRTEQTFRLIYGDEEHRKIHALREMNFGKFEKLLIENAKEDPEFLKWSQDKTGDMVPEGGESFNHFRSRVSSGITSLVEMVEREARSPEVKLKKPGEAEAVAVCHGGVISAIIYERFKTEGDHIYAWVPVPGRGYRLMYKDGELVDFHEI